MMAVTTATKAKKRDEAAHFEGTGRGKEVEARSKPRVEPEHGGEREVLRIMVENGLWE